MRRLARVMILAAALTASGQAAQACPNCKEAVASQTGDQEGLKRGYFYSILFMMGMPFTLLGVGAFFVARAVKRGALPEM